MPPAETAPPIPPAPPTQPELIPVAKPSSWPTAIGAICLVLAGFGLLCNVMTIGGQFATGMLTAFSLPGQAAALGEIQEKWQAWNISVAVTTILAAFLLLAGGIGLLGRKQWSVRACAIWSVIKIIITVAVSGVGYFAQSDQFELLTQNDPNAAAMRGFFAVIPVLSVLFGLLWGCAYPTFLLIWFSRAKIKQEVAGWA